MSCYHYLLFCLFIVFCNAAKHQSPMPHRPDDPVVYPEDYCERMKNDEQFDYIVIGSRHIFSPAGTRNTNSNVSEKALSQLAEEKLRTALLKPAYLRYYHSFFKGRHIVVCPAGTTLSRRLAENPKHKVLLLEAGDDPPVESDIPINGPKNYPKSMFWNIKAAKTPYTCKGFENETCPYPLAKVLGGCSIINTMLYVRGNKEDYNEWEASGCPGWGYKDLLPYFLKLENFVTDKPLDEKYHSKGGPFTTTYAPMDPKTAKVEGALLEALKENNVPINPDTNGKSQIGFGYTTGSIETTGYRNNILKSYLLNIPDNLRVCKNALVTKLVISNGKKGMKKRVEAVEFIYKGSEKRKVTAKREYIVTGGPANTPQILERSGIGRKDVLDKAGVNVVHELNGVGENFQEQYGNLGCIFTADFHNQVSQNPVSFSMRTLTGFLNMTDYSSPVPDLQFIFEPNFRFRSKSDIAADVEKKTKGKDVLLGFSVLLRQAKRGSVHIVKSDPLARPILKLNQYTTEAERKLQASGCRFVRKIFQSKAMAQYDIKPIILKRCEKYPVNSDDEIICAIKLLPQGTHHLSGSAKMGPTSDPMAVVDDRLRVHGIGGLRIADLSVMPNVVRGNTEIPTIAVAEKAADIIKKDHST